MQLISLDLHDSEIQRNQLAHITHPSWHSQELHPGLLTSSTLLYGWLRKAGLAFHALAQQGSHYCELLEFMSQSQKTKIKSISLSFNNTSFFVLVWNELGGGTEDDPTWCWFWYWAASLRPPKRAAGPQDGPAKSGE